MSRSAVAVATAVVQKGVQVVEVDAPGIIGQRSLAGQVEDVTLQQVGGGRERSSWYRAAGPRRLLG